MPSAVVHRSQSPSPPPAKRQKIELRSPSESHPIIPEPQLSGQSEPINHANAAETLESTLNYRNGVMLAPMVRSGTLPSRLLALSFGADLVWGPEIVDRGMIGCSRTVDEETGVITYEKAGKPVWSTHPIEKPYLIYQIGSANPELAAQSALMVAQDVSGVELNCGCPTHFSTHGGMGANLLSTPELLCDILVKLRATVPPSVAVSAKIRLLPSQEDTLTLIKKIVSTGISCLTVHCRTKEMRHREPALVHRLKEIVDYVDSLGLGVPLIANGDCLSRDDAVRLREVTGAHSVMIGTAAEKNLSCFTPGRPLVDAETELVPKYAALARYLKNPWGNSKHCLSQFQSPRAAVHAPASPVDDTIPAATRGAPRNKATLKDFKQRLSQAKDYEALGTIAVGGAEVLEEVKRVLARRATTEPEAYMNTSLSTESSHTGSVAPQSEVCESHQAAAFESPLTVGRILSPGPVLGEPSTNYVTGDVHHRVPLAV